MKQYTAALCLVDGAQETVPITASNSGFASLTGYSPEEMKGTSLAVLAGELCFYIAV